MSGPIRQYRLNNFNQNPSNYLLSFQISTTPPNRVDSNPRPQALKPITPSFYFLTQISLFPLPRSVFQEIRAATPFLTMTLARRISLVGHRYCHAPHIGFPADASWSARPGRAVV